MVDILTAIFSGSMLPVIPLLLMRALEFENIEEKKWRAGALVLLAVFAWLVAAYMFFLAPLFGLGGALLGGVFTWRISRTPRIIVQNIEEDDDLSRAADEEADTKPKQDI